jgi:hypothetical protein
MKSTILLTTALFLASAPSPDAKTISELSAGFLSVENDYGLMASEDTLSGRFNPRIPAQLESLQINSIYKSADNDIDSAERDIAALPEQARIN